MIEIMKLHFRNKWHSILVIILILLSIMLFMVTPQLIWGVNCTIHIGKSNLGFWFGVLGPILILKRGKNGEGKFLSRLPSSRYEIFGGKVLFLVLVYLLIATFTYAGSWILVALIKLLQPSLAIDGTPNIHLIIGDAITFLKIMPIFLFFTVFNLWLQKWISSNDANLLVTLGVVVVFVLLPAIAVISAKHHTLIISSGDITNFLNAYGTPLIISLNLALFFGAMGLYRLRHFRNF